MWCVRFGVSQIVLTLGWISIKLNRYSIVSSASMCVSAVLHRAVYIPHTQHSSSKELQHTIQSSKAETLSQSCENSLDTEPLMPQ